MSTEHSNEVRPDTSGVDNGPLSGRAVPVSAQEGAELDGVVLARPGAAITDELPSDWALQVPNDRRLAATIGAVRA
jgi:hypothetical protein